MAPSQINVGVVGAGANTKLHHIPKLLAIDGVRMVTVANRTVVSARRVLQQFNIPELTPSGRPAATDNWRHVVEDPNIHAVVVGTWPDMHCTVSVAALQAGKHVLCEARLARDAHEARQMVAELRRQPGLVAQVVPSPFTLPWDRTIQDIVTSGKLGELAYASVRGLGPAWPDAPGAQLNWRQDWRTSGCNILTMGIFYEALQRWVGDATRVMAMAKTVVQLRTRPEAGAAEGVLVPDHVDVLAQLACGAQAHLVFSAVTGAPRPRHRAARLRLGPSATPKQEFWLHGSQGVLHLNLDEGLLKADYRQPGEAPLQLKVDDIPKDKRGYWRVEEEFVGAIRGQEPVRLTDWVTGLRYMEFTEAVTRSYKSGRAVDLPLLD